MISFPCRVFEDGRSITLSSPHFHFILDASSGLCARSLTNTDSGTRLNFEGGTELKATLDASDRIIPISGWRGIDDAQGEVKGYVAPDFDDSKWESNLSPPYFFTNTAPDIAWMRTHLFVPANARGKTLTLVLGGIGIWDFKSMRVFVNGHEVGMRKVDRRWNKPGEFEISGQVFFGTDNVLVIELRNQVRRTKHLEDSDPNHARELSWLHTWPAQFEQYLVVGAMPIEAAFEVTGWKVTEKERESSICFDLLDSSLSLAAKVEYSWNAEEPILRKEVILRNESGREVTLLSLHLGDYTFDAVATEGEQGFPVYICDEFFATLAHPAGWAMGEDRSVSLRQHPGCRIVPGETFTSFQALWGVASAGQVQTSFRSHLASRMRRVRRSHDRPYAIFNAYGFWEIPEGAFLGDAASAQRHTKNIQSLAQRMPSIQYDFYALSFWTDYRGDLRRFNTVNFPEGFSEIREILDEIGIAPGLWIDSARGVWSVGGNPVLASSMTHDPAYPPPHFHHHFCRATDPAKSIYETAVLHHLEENDVRLFFFDDLYATCYNPNHDHLPGLYSTEAIFNSVIESLQILDRNCPEAFIMLYWGYRSPWWLLHGDTIFESGLCIEAASPGITPTPYARDGVNVGLDMALSYSQEIPALGKDSLGIWLSKWPWNSMLGKERWEQGFILDMCRGGLLAQIWSEDDTLSSEEIEQLKIFIDLLRAAPRCFSNSYAIFGDPWKGEPYGYCCFDGVRAFLVLNNCTWEDTTLFYGEEIRQKWESAHSSLEVYRWYPERAQLKGGYGSIALRPYEVVLLEIVPSGNLPTLDISFDPAPTPICFAEASVELSLFIVSSKDGSLAPGGLIKERPESEPATPASVVSVERILNFKGQLPPSQFGGILYLSVDRKRGGKDFQTHYPGHEMNLSIRLAHREEKPQPVLGTYTYPSSWQGWRISVAPDLEVRFFQGEIVVHLAPGVETHCAGHFIPFQAIPSSERPFLPSSVAESHEVAGESIGSNPQLLGIE